MTTAFELPATISVVAWCDPVAQAHGFPVDDPYTEAVWCSLLGPTSLLLLRRLAAAARSAPTGVTVDLGDLAVTLGVRPPIVTRALRRLVRFGFVAPGVTLRVRVHVAPVPDRLLARVSPSGLRYHRQATDRRAPADRR